MRLLVVIVNYRSASLTLDCLRSLAPELDAVGAGTVRVVVADNDSGDDSVDRLRAAVADNGWSGFVEIDPLPRNGGFAYGNNAPIRRALAGASPPDYVLLLNPDTLVRPDAVGALLRFMDEHPSVGIAGSRLEFPDGSVQRSAFRFHSVLGELENGIRLGPISRLLRRRIVAPPPPAEACRVDWVAGASMIVRRAVFESAGLMDERYFMYFEEVDFCLQARRAGWPCWYAPASRVVHLVGQTSGVTDARQSRKRRPAYWFASRSRYFRKNHGRLKAILADLAWSAGFASYRARQFVQRKPDVDPARLLRDFVHHGVAAALPVRTRREAVAGPVGEPRPARQAGA